MTDPLDRILSQDDSLEPSSGFGASVMAAVRRQADEPPPIPFPWIRFAVGLVACVALGAAGARLLERIEPAPFPALSALSASLAPLASALPIFGWAAAAVVLTIAVSRLPRLLTRR
jgi:hypothetical protein